MGLSVGDLAILHAEHHGRVWYLCTVVLALYRGTYAKSTETALRLAGMHGHPCMHDIQLLSLGHWKSSDSAMAITPGDTRRRRIVGSMTCDMGIWLFPTGVDIGLPALVQPACRHPHQPVYESGGSACTPAATHSHAQRYHCSNAPQ